jgi:hypothetical protein
MVAGGSRALLDSQEPLCLRMDGAILRIAVLGDREPPIFGVEVHILMSSWSWCLLICQIFLNKIHRFGSCGPAEVPSLNFLIVVLARNRHTCPGPGIFCN